MIQINANLRTEVQVLFDMTGNETVPTLRLYFLCSGEAGDFFVGFDGDNKRIDIPELTNIVFPQKVKARVEVVLGNYNLKIWEEPISIIQTQTFLENINRINIKVKLKQEKSTEPLINIKPKN